MKVIKDLGEDNFQILSLSGGGYFGLYQAVILSELEEEIGKPTTIKGLAMGEFRNTINKPGLQKMLEYTAKKPHFYHGKHSN